MGIKQGREGLPGEDEKVRFAMRNGCLGKHSGALR